MLRRDETRSFFLSHFPHSASARHHIRTLRRSNHGSRWCVLTWASTGALLWMTGLILQLWVHLHIFTFLTASHTLFFSPCWMQVCVCVSVLLQGREGEACLFQGTPPELMFHTCAQRGTLYRASQVHCINCGRNHFIGGRRGAAAVVVVVVERGSSCTSSSSSLAHIQSLNIHI